MLICIVDDSIFVRRAWQYALPGSRAFASPSEVKYALERRELDGSKVSAWVLDVEFGPAEISGFELARFLRPINATPMFYFSTHHLVQADLLEELKPCQTAGKVITDLARKISIDLGEAME